MRLWRIARRRYRERAFTGEQTAIAGGRWNGKGRRVVYLSSHLSLAALEVLVNADLAAMPMDYVAIPVDVPDDIPRDIVDVAGLPKDWQQSGNEYCVALGNAWCDAAGTLLLDVPSAVIPLERNVVLNATHPSFQAIDTSHPGYPFQFDPRLLPIVERPPE